MVLSTRHDPSLKFLHFKIRNPKLDVFIPLVIDIYGLYLYGQEVIKDSFLANLYDIGGISPGLGWSRSTAVLATLIIEQI
jgi:hypothetical protein